MRGVCARVRSHARNESNSRRFSPRKLASKSTTETGWPRLVRESIERGRKTGKIRSYNAPLPPLRTGCSQRGLLFLTSSRHLAVAGSCHPLDVTWTSVHAFPANCRESTPMETSGNDSRRNEPIDRRGFEQGGYVSIFNEDWKGFGWSIGDRTGQG